MSSDNELDDDDTDYDDDSTKASSLGFAFGSSTYDIHEKYSIDWKTDKHTELIDIGTRIIIRIKER